jgi:hypothetical protein
MSGGSRLTGGERRTMQDALLAEMLAEVRAERSNSTETFAQLRSSITNDVLDSGAYVLDGNGLVTQAYQTPYGSLFLANLGAGDMTVTSAPPATGAPTRGRGVHIVPAHSAALLNLAGTAWTIYGTAGDLADVQAFTRPWPPYAAGALARSGASGLVADAHGFVFDGTTWAQSRALGAAGDGLGVQLVSQPGSAPFNDVGAAGAAVSRVIAAVAGQRHRLTGLSCSYSAAASTGTGLLTVTDGATVIAGWDVPLTVNTPFTAPLPVGGLLGSVNTALTITLAAGAAGTVGRLNTAKLTA